MLLTLQGGLFDGRRSPVFADLIEETQRSRWYFMLLFAVRTDHGVAALESTLDVLRMDYHVHPASTSQVVKNEFIFHGVAPIGILARSVATLATTYRQIPSWPASNSNAIQIQNARRKGRGDHRSRPTFMSKNSPKISTGQNYQLPRFFWGQMTTAIFAFGG